MHVFVSEAAHSGFEVASKGSVGKGDVGTGRVGSVRGVGGVGV